MFLICILPFFLTSRAAIQDELIFSRYYLGQITFPSQSTYGCRNRFIEIYNPTESRIELDGNYFLYFGSDPSLFHNNKKSFALEIFNQNSDYIGPRETHLISDKHAEIGFNNIRDVKQSNNFYSHGGTLTNASVVGLMRIDRSNKADFYTRTLIDVLGYKNTNGWTKNRTFLVRKGYEQEPRTTFSWNDWHQFDVSQGSYGIFLDESRHYNASEISPSPTRSPSTSLPSRSPSTSVPTKSPSTTQPTLFPTTSIPSKTPTTSPSKSPSVLPSKNPSVSPSISPSKPPSANKSSNAGDHPHMDDMVIAALITLTLICFCFIFVVCCKVFCGEKQNRGWSFRSSEELNSWNHYLARPAERGEGLIGISRNPGRGDDLGITPRERKDSEDRLEGERKYSGPTGYSVVNQRPVEGRLNPGVVNLPENPSQRRRHGRVPSKEIPPDWLKNSKIQ